MSDDVAPLGTPPVVSVTVEASDIRAGRPTEELLCPVALASSRAFGEPVSVGPTIMKFADGRAFLLPMPVQRFILAFDCEWPVYPFLFQVPLDEILPSVDDVIKRGFMYEGSDESNSHSAAH